MSDIAVAMLLLHGATKRAPLKAEEWRRVAARVAWTREMVARLRAAQRAMDDRCCEAVERLSEQDFERLCDAEQAKVDAIAALLKAAADRDEWPRELYWSL
jgi:cobalamin biosynthesis protein CobT